MKLSLVTVILLLFPSSLEAEKPAPSFDESVAPFLQEYCLHCHNEKKQKGDFRIDTLSRDFLAGTDAELWIEMMDRINSGEMPPEEETQPFGDEIEKVVGWLGERIKEAERFRMAQRAPVTIYRLSREEYANSVYDLLGVKYDPAAPGEMSEDPGWHGFTRIGSELSLSSSHVEKYIKAAKTILDVAYPDKQAVTKIYRKDALDIDWPNTKKRSLLREQGIENKVRTLMWPGHKLSNAGPHHATIPPGIYKVRMQLSGLQPPGGRPPHVTIYSKEMDQMIFEQDVIAPEKQPVVLEFETWLSGPGRMTVNNDVPGPSNSPRSGRPTGEFVFTTLDNPLSRAPWQRKMTDDEGNPIYPFLIFDWIEWEGPINSEETIQKRQRFFPEETTDLSVITNHLTRFSEKAWRRPVSPEEVARYIGIFENAVALGEPFRRAYKTAMLGILASKNFYYIAEGSVTEKRDTVTDSELASRLSYFLWSSIPDERLVSLAKQERLHVPDVLKAEVQRMMSDPKIDRFTSSFPHQWFQLDKVGTFPPDEKLYPDYDKWLEKSMVIETTEFYKEVFKNNQSLREFLDSDWTILNPRLALHYGLPPLPKSGFQRVSLSPDSNRGGVLTHGSALSLSSDGTRHRPVHRGVWVSEAIFGKVPNPPPANVDAIEPNPVDKPKATIREKLAAHTANATCSSCHKTIDPLGLALDNYDAVGRWRTEEIVHKGTGSNPPVDASGALPDGRTFSGPAEFKKLLCEDIDHFSEAFVEKLATYALRRAMTVTDRDAIEEIAAKNRDKHYPLRDIVETFVLSDLFQTR
ncbi:MAG: DUF1592 domain-containing protein [Verrucomicrobiales bacterium]|nr:DUF1592 domain-containing protein [Verrucomicrobiales bacterium]